MMLLAQAQTTGTGGILTPFVIIFGWIIRAIYGGLATMGIYNVGLCIILFEFDNTRVVSRLLEGEYYKISQMLSSDYETKITINKKEFLNCIDRASLLIRESDKKPIIIDITDHSLKLNINSFFGSMEEEILIQKEGRDLLIGFNPKFLMDVLRVIDDEEINIYLVNPKAPCYIKDDAGTYNYLILPVNFNH